MNSYSQSGEDLKVVEYFGDHVGCLLEIGANTGTVLSNSRLLIEKNWLALLVEPSPKAFADLCGSYLHLDDVYCIQVAVSDKKSKSADFYESGEHFKGKGDKALLSSLSKKETERWGNSTTFEKIKVDVVDFKTLLKLSPYKEFDFISCDCEGCEQLVIPQMNLTELKCKVICVEHNGNEQTLQIIKNHCAQHGLTNELLKNYENIILAI